MEKLIEYSWTRLFMVKESLRLVKSDPEKHAKKVIGLWFMPLLIRGSGVGRDAYFFMRNIDDVIDGDLVIKQNPADYVSDIRKDIVADFQNPNYPVEQLAFRSIKLLNQRKKESDDPKQEFINGIDGMVGDIKRRETKEILTADELERYYVKSFGPHFNIMSISIRSNLREGDIKPFICYQGLAYSIQDLSTDWQRGLINVPKEVLCQSGLKVSASVLEVQSNPIIREWIVNESCEKTRKLNTFLTQTSELKGENSANLILNSLSRRMKRIFESNMLPRKVISVSGSN